MRIHSAPCAFSSTSAHCKATLRGPARNLLCGCLLLALSSTSANADDWINPGSGDWFLGSNWADGTVPTGADSAFVDNGGTAGLSNFEAVANLVVVGRSQGKSGSLEITDNGQLTGAFSWIGDNAGSVGEVRVDGVNARWEATQLIVGRSGTGFLSVLGGASVVSADGVIGNKGVGAVLVEGAGSTWTNHGNLTIGLFDTALGRLDILFGGTVSNQSASIGASADLTTVTVDGVGSVWDSNGEVTIGNSGAGALDLLNSGTATVAGGTGTLVLGKFFGNGNGRGDLNIGLGEVPGILRAAKVVGGDGDSSINFNHSSTNYAFTSTGNLSGSPVAIEGSAIVNQIGLGSTTLLGANTYSGSTNVIAGELVVMGAIDSTSPFTVAPTGSADAAIRKGGTVRSVRGVLGSGVGSSGRMEVSGVGSTWSTDGELIVGQAGTGSLVFTDGGSSIIGASQFPGELVVGKDVGSTGTLIVDGPGTRINAAQGMLIGPEGSGRLDILRGGSVVTSNTNVVASFPSGQGVVTVDGVNSKWTTTGLVLGRRGHAELLVSSGGQIVTPGPVWIGGATDADSGSGVAVIDGQGSEWLATGGVSFLIGETGSGILRVRNGALVEADSVMLGGRANGVGELSVDGPTSTFRSVNGLDVGALGAATFNITAGGHVINSFANIAGASGVVATATVDGNGSRWEIGGAQFPFRVGVRGIAVLSVQNDGAVSVGGGVGTLRLASFSESTSALNIGSGSDSGAGVIEASLVDGVGSASLNFNHGELDYYFTRNGQLGGGVVRIGGNVAVSQVGTGTTSLLGFNDYSGATTVNAGTLRVMGSITSAASVNNGGTLSGSGTVAAVSVADGGSLAPGNTVGTLTTGRLTLANGSRLNFELGAPGVGSSDSLTVVGDLVLDGVLSVQVLPGFSVGTYRLVNYSGALINSGLNVVGLPSGYSGTVDVATHGQVNLVVINSAFPSNSAPTGAVNIIGTPREGTTLVATSTLADADGLGTLSYQWYLDDAAAFLATGVSFALDDLSVGKAVRVTVSYVDGHGFAEQVSSAAVGPVAPAGTDLPFQKRVFFVNPADNVNQQTFIRLVNPNDADVAVQIQGFDDNGTPAPGGDVVLVMSAQESLQINAADLELGNAGKGMDGALGNGDGKWHLKVNSAAPIEAMSLIRTPDGFLTSVTETVPAEVSPGVHVLYFANPGSNPNQQSFIRVVNRGAASGEVNVFATDDAGVPAPGGVIRFTLAANAALNFNAEDYTNGSPAKGMQGAFGTGTGKWRVTVSSALNLEVMSLIRTPDGFLTDLSNIAPRAAANDDSDRLLLGVNPGNNAIQQSLIRLVNGGGLTEHVILSGTDDTGVMAPASVGVDVPPFGAVQLLGSDLEQGNPAKGLTGAFGSGQGRWQISVTPQARVEAQSLLRVPGGFLTNLSASAPRDSRFEARLWIFNPGSNDQQRSILRLINRSDTAGVALIEAIDDAGQPAPGGSATVNLAQRAAVELSALELEIGSAAKGLIGALGDGSGKWRLHVSADVDIEVQGLLETPTGFLTNLSSTVH